MSWISWMNLTFYKWTSPSSSPSLSTQIYAHHEERNWRLWRGQSSSLISQSVFAYHWCSVPSGWRQSNGLFYWCIKHELVRELKLPESLCNCPFSDSSLDRKLPLQLPEGDLSVQTPLPHTAIAVSAVIVQIWEAPLSVANPGSVTRFLLHRMDNV